MSQLSGRLGSLRAQDVMTRDVIMLRESDSINYAVRSLKEHHITGAPVVDAEGRFVGILSVSDLVRAVPFVAPPGSPPIALAHGNDITTWDLFDKAGPLHPDVGVERVGQRMSRQVTSVLYSAPLVEVARVMCEGHWHRVPVVKPSGALCGIISTMDILAALVNAADEPE